MTKIKEFKDKTEAELQKMIEDKKVAIKDLRFNLAGGKIKNLKEARNNRRDIARALTILNNKSKTI